MHALSYERLRKTLELLLLACLALPASAYAQTSNLTCNGPQPVGNLYDTSTYCSGTLGLQNIFSGLVCNFQTMLNAIMGLVYCGMQYSLLQPLKMALVLFVIVFGIQLTTGYAQASGREVVTRIIKIALVWTFATNANWAIGLGYNFFTATANSGVSWMFDVIPIPTANPNSSCPLLTLNPANIQGAAFRYMDYMICIIITGPFTAAGAALSGFFAVLAWMLPPVFAMFSYFFIKSAKIFIRALFSYLLAMSAIAFLITLSPIFVSLALFKPTQHFFEDWLKFMISFTMQIILIFAGLALWITIILQLLGFFNNLSTMIRKVTDSTMADNVRVPMDTWGICQYQLTQTFWGPFLQCTDHPVGLLDWCNGVQIKTTGQYCPAPIKPSELVQHQDFLFFLIINLLSVCTVVYVFDTLMGMLPGMAKQLAGSAHSPQMGGGKGFGAIDFGLSAFEPGGSGEASGNFIEQIKGLLTKDKS